MTANTDFIKTCIQEATALVFTYDPVKTAEGEMQLSNIVDALNAQLAADQEEGTTEAMVVQILDELESENPNGKEAFLCTLIGHAAQPLPIYDRLIQQREDEAHVWQAQGEYGKAAAIMVKLALVMQHPAYRAITKSAADEALMALCSQINMHDPASVHTPDILNVPAYLLPAISFESTRDDVDEDFIDKMGQALYAISLQKYASQMEDAACIPDNDERLIAISRQCISELGELAATLPAEAGLQTTIVKVGTELLQDLYNLRPQEMLSSSIGFWGRLEGRESYREQFGFALLGCLRKLGENDRETAEKGRQEWWNACENNEELLVALDHLPHAWDKALLISLDRPTGKLITPPQGQLRQ